MVLAVLNSAGFEAYLVGGCVRDHLMSRVPNDYDITTSATPEEIVALFPRTHYENVYGTVGVVTTPEYKENGDKNEEIVTSTIRAEPKPAHE